MRQEEGKERDAGERAQHSMACSVGRAVARLHLGHHQQGPRNTWRWSPGRSLSLGLQTEVLRASLVPAGATGVRSIAEGEGLKFQ